MKPKLSTLVFVLVGLVFLLAFVYHIAQGEPLTLSPALAAAIGFFLAAVVSLFVNRKSDGGSGPPKV